MHGMDVHCTTNELLMIKCFFLCVASVRAATFFNTSECLQFVINNKCECVSECAMSKEATYCK